MNLIQRIGKETLDGLAGAGRGFRMMCGILCHLDQCWKLRREIVEQMHILAIGSLPLVLLTSVFTGGITAVQSGYQMKSYVPMIFLGTLVTKSVILEMGPVLAALVVGSRLSANYAAELGTMKVRQETDALTVMGMDIWSYLVTPKMLALISAAAGMTLTTPAAPTTKPR